MRGGEKRTIKLDLWDDEISIIEGGVMEMNQDVVITQLWDFCFLFELQTIETALTGDDPSLCSRRSHLVLTVYND